MWGRDHIKKWIITAVVIVAAIGAWYFASPSLALSGMRDAAESRDAERLAGYIDYPALRESLKTELRVAMAREMADIPQEEQGFAALGMGIGMAMIDPMIEALVTPEALATMIENAGDAPESVGSETQDTDLEIRRVGFSEFRVINPENPEAPEMIFRRSSLGWKLSGMNIGEDMWGSEGLSGTE